MFIIGINWKQHNYDERKNEFGVVSLYNRQLYTAKLNNSELHVSILMHNSQKHNYEFAKIKMIELFTYDPLIKTLKDTSYIISYLG